MSVRSRRTLYIALVLATAVTATACAKVTIQAAPWGTPLEAVTAAAERFADGVNYEGTLDGDEGDRTGILGSDIPAQEKLRAFKTGDGTQETLRIGDELWLKYDADQLPKDWGHFADGTEYLAAGGAVGPSTWVPALIEQITEIERVDELAFEGVLDFDEVNEDETGFSKYELLDLEDGDEVGFRIRMNADGTIASFAFDLEGTARGQSRVEYTFSDYGAATDVVPPSGPMTELTMSNVLDWLLGELDG